MTSSRPGRLDVVREPREVGWGTCDGEPNQEGWDGWRFMNEVLTNKESAPWTLSRLRFRDPDKFVAGGIHNKLVSWQRVLEDHPKHELIIRWIRDGIHVMLCYLCTRRIRVLLLLLKNLVSVFVVLTLQSVRYDCDLPVPRVFRNHGSCKKVSRFIGNTILQLLSTGAVKVWARLNHDEPPSVVLPLTVDGTVENQGVH